MRRWSNTALRTRMAAVGGLAVAVAVVAVAFSVYFAVRSSLRGEVDQSLRDRATNVLVRDSRPEHHRGDGRGGPGRPPQGGGPPGGGAGDAGGGATAAATASPFGGPTGKLQFIDRDGSVHWPPDQQTGSFPTTPRAKAIAAAGRGVYVADEQANGTHLRVLTVGRGPRGAIQVARPLTEVDRELSSLLLILIFVGVGGILLAVGLGLVVARTALAPIARFTRDTETLASSADLSGRLEVEGKDELARLARTFNETLDSLERSVESQRHLVADASHELRTPIASLRANVQVLQDAHRLPPAERENLRNDIIGELDELTALVGDVVELARSSKRREALDEVRLDEIVQAAVERARRRSGDLELRAQLEPTLVSGEPDRINRAVSNLLDNARKWSPPGCAIDVGLADGTLTVRDRGPGFNERDLPHVFDRFYRADNARQMPGSGLGLAIVRQATETHGGFARAENAPDGGAILRVGFGPPLPRDELAPAAVDAAPAPTAP